MTRRQGKRPYDTDDSAEPTRRARYDLRARFDPPERDGLIRNPATAVTKPPLDTVTEGCYAPIMPLDPDELAKLRAIAERQNAWADANGVAFMVVDRRGRRRVVHTGTLATMVGRRRCPRCGEEFWFDALTRRRAKYCSPPCRQAAYRDRHPKPERLKPMAELAAKCQQCGGPIPEQLRRGRDTGRPALWCSPACRQKAHRARKRVPA